MRLFLHDYAGHPFQAQLSRELARRNHIVQHAYAGGLETPRGSLEHRPGDPASLAFQEVPMSPEYRKYKYSFLKRRGFELQYGKDLAKAVAGFRPDLVLSGNTPTEAQWTMVRAAQSLGIPVVSWVQDFYSVAVATLARKKLPVIGHLAGMWYHHLDRQCLRKSAAVVSITEDFVPILERFGVARQRITVIPNWAPLDELPLKPRPNAWSTRMGLDGKFVFLYSGTLALKHNPDLLRQLAVQFQDDPGVRVVVISEGPGATYLRGRVASDRLTNLEILPYQPFDQMPEVLASADVLVAILEPDAGIFSVPSKVLTYHCAGRAILGAIPSQNLASRIITRNGSGICVDPTDNLAFLKACSTVRSKPATCTEMARKARAYAETEFDILRIADRFESVFTQAAKRS